jgi:hypothetical protein
LIEDSLDHRPHHSPNLTHCGTISLQHTIAAARYRERQTNRRTGRANHDRPTDFRLHEPRRVTW